MKRFANPTEPVQSEPMDNPTYSSNNSEHASARTFVSHSLAAHEEKNYGLYDNPMYRQTSGHGQADRQDDGFYTDADLPRKPIDEEGDFYIGPGSPATMDAFHKQQELENADLEAMYDLPGQSANIYEAT